MTLLEVEGLSVRFASPRGDVRAVSDVSLRLAPGQDVHAITQAFEAMLRAAVPEGATLELELRSASQPSLVAADSQAIRLGLDAFERAVGIRPLLIRAGGSLFKPRSLP